MFSAEVADAAVEAADEIEDFGQPGRRCRQLLGKGGDARLDDLALAQAGARAEAAQQGVGPLIQAYGENAHGSRSLFVTKITLQGLVRSRNVSGERLEPLAALAAGVLTG
jgi:hypothetical protein